MKAFVSYLDFLSHKPELNINKKARLKSLTNGIMSIIASILIIVVTSYFTSQLLNRDDPTVAYNKLPNGILKQNMSNYPYIIGLFTNFTTPINEDSTFYSLQSQLVKMTVDNSSGKPQQMIQTFNIAQEKCDINKHFGEYRAYFEDVPYLSSYYCPVPNANNISIYGQFGSNDNIFFGHQFYKCINNTLLNKTNCKDTNTINSYLMNSIILYKFLEFSIDHKNISNPGFINLRYDTLAVSTSVLTRYWYYVTNIVYTSDIGYIFESLDVRNYYHYTRPSATINLYQPTLAPTSFAQIIISMDQHYDSYKRNFMKVQNLLANTGGIIKGILVCFDIILYYFNSEIIYFELISSMFTLYTHMDEGPSKM